MCISKRDRRSGNLAQINYTYTKASLACASLTVFAPGFQHTSAAACTEHQRENPIVVNVHETLHTGENSSSSNARKRTKGDRSPAWCLCSRGTGRKGVLTVSATWPRAAMPCGFSADGAPTGEGRCWSMLASVPNNTPFMSLKRRLCPSTAEESPASSHTSWPRLLPLQKATGETVPKENRPGKESFPQK